MEDNSSLEALEENTKPCSDPIMIKLQRKQSGALTLVPRDRILIASGDRMRQRFTRLWSVYPPCGFTRLRRAGAQAADTGIFRPNFYNSKLL
jgi:hypothetical protein